MPQVVKLNKDVLTEKLLSAAASGELGALQAEISVLKSAVVSPDKDSSGVLSAAGTEESATYRQDALVSQLDQILEARTFERARYYVNRLLKGVNGSRTGKVNDIDLNRWKEYDEVITDSLWVLQKRDTSGVHVAWYWGNFIPQIPRQLLLRYTKKGDWVVDAFVGSGTTLIECRRLGRNGIGVELNPKVAEAAAKHVNEENNPFGVVSKVITADSTAMDVSAALKNAGVKKYQLLVMHPPYHDIIPFSDDERDLSNAPDVEEYLRLFGHSVDNFAKYLEKGRYFGLVIGDKYSAGEWIPLGFRCMDEVLRRGFSLKSIVVKNFDFTRAKQNQQELWRYRALVGGFYVFKHEYVMIFRKMK